MLDRFAELSFTPEQLDEIKAYYTEYHSEEIEPLNHDDFLEFSRTGNRINYENKYFNRRHRINGAFMMRRAYGDAYADELHKLLYAVCDEETWALPAHAPEPDNARNVIDLFAAETGMMLSEIIYLSGDGISDELRSRIITEIRERLFIPFSQNKFHWETAKHNWSAVCAGALGITYLRVAPDEMSAERILKAMSAYIDGYNDDGVCLEGIGYWCYGFGFYMYFAAELLRERGVDIIRSDKNKRVAEFMRHITIYGEACVSCSDAPARFSAPMGLFGLISEFYGLAPAEGVNVSRTDECGRWAHYIRSWLYPAPKPVPVKSEELVFRESQWYINRKDRYGFFIKGGSNDEPHNHNDIGSFVIADSSGQLLCDFGMGEYTKDYFDENTRYNYLCNSSFGHSVPIIDGEGQRAGDIYRCDSFECGNDSARISFGSAYGSGITAERELTLRGDKIELRDVFAFADGKPHRVRERFVTLIEPKITSGEIIIGGMRMNRTGAVTREFIRAHDGRPTAMYLIDIDADKEFTMEFKFVNSEAAG